MKLNLKTAFAAGSIALACAVAMAPAGAAPPKRNFFTIPKQDIRHKPGKANLRDSEQVYRCEGPVSQVVDIADESWRTTKAVYGSSPGGGVGGQFDPNPLLDVMVDIPPGSCLDAHFSGIVGSTLYGASPLALFEVTVQPTSPVFAPGTPLIGHFATPYGIPSPAIGTQSEQDVDQVGANFFIHTGDGPREIMPGSNRVIVWWAGGPPGSTGGAAGSAFVLKLYVRGK